MKIKVYKFFNGKRLLIKESEIQKYAPGFIVTYNLYYFAKCKKSNKTLKITNTLRVGCDFFSKIADES